MNRTRIEWCDLSWNPMPGCSHTSLACTHCWAERQAGNIAMYQKKLVENGRWTGETMFQPEKLIMPIGVRDPKSIAVNLMGDLWHEKNDSGHIAAVMTLPLICPWHTFYFLTKRVVSMGHWFTAWMDSEEDAPEDVCIMHGIRANAKLGQHEHVYGWPPENAIFGVSVENQETWNARVEMLARLRCRRPGLRTCVSVEPILGPIDMSFAGTLPSAWTGSAYIQLQDCIDWVVVGGQSGPGARTTHLDWIESVVRQCQEAGIPVYVKQLGAYYYDGTNIIQPRHRRGADIETFPRHLRIREMHP